jgi:sugar phosphate isomerase/epimerase
MYKVGINFDEISDNLDEATRLMWQQKVVYGELRTVNKKNFVFWTDPEVRDFKAKIGVSGIELVAAATPLFKWYDEETDPEVVHDNFGFNPRLSYEKKKQMIDRALDIANQLAIPRLRIFSGLGRLEVAGKSFADSELLTYALTQADAQNIDLYLENEPVCKVHTKSDILDLLKYNSHPRLNLWLDIANLIEIGEDLDPEFIKSVAGRLGYVHVKDFIEKDGEKTYVPVGKGKIAYDTAIQLLYHEKQDGIVITVETHAKTDKMSMSEQSIIGLREILEKQGVTYE